MNALRLARARRLRETMPAASLMQCIRFVKLNERVTRKRSRLLVTGYRQHTHHCSPVY